MKTIKHLKLAAAVAAGIALVGCGSDDESTGGDLSVVDCSSGRTVDIAANVLANETSVSEELSTALNTAKTCDTIVLPEGKHTISSSLSFDGNGSLGQDTMVTNLTIKGAGMPEAASEAATQNSGLTALDFTGTAGDGFFIKNTKNITMEDLGVFEAANNAIKLKDTDGIVLRSVSTVWETDYQSSNGAYGLYPVETQNVLIEDCFVKGSADAGVYVGQSHNIVVRNNIATKNVAGIEIENSTNADVYGNTAEGNTGGILIFDLPIGNGLYGSGVRIFDNDVIANNAPNFANASDFAGGVHIVPPGTGVIVLSTSDVEIFNNTISDHQTTSIAITSYMMPDASVAALPNQDVGGADGDENTPAVMSYGDIHPYATEYLDGWSPLTRGINIHDNTITVAAGVNDPQGNLIQDIIDGMGQAQSSELGGLNNGNPQLPHILYDGVGELLANVVTDQNAPEVGVMQELAAGVNTIASAVYALIINPMDNDAELAQIPDLGKFAKYTNTAADRVCQSDNGVDGETIFAAAVFETAPSADNINGETLEPFSKLEMFGAAAVEYQTAVAMEDAAAAEAAGAEMAAIHATLLADDTMTCSGFDAFVGSAAVVTVNGESFGCGADDTTSTFCQ